MMRPQDLWEGHGARERAVRALLTPLSWLYALGWQSYLATYALKIKRAAEPHRPMICVGSLVAGGSGKSPLTMHIARVLTAMGKAVVIGCNGYRGQRSKGATIAPMGPLSASEWGDEPAMFRWLLPDVPLVVGRNRAYAAELVHSAYPNAALVMDDGFQHLPVKKHLTLLLDDPDPANSMVLPAGPHREPRSNRKRADLTIPGDYALVREPMRIVSVAGHPANPKRYAVLCALGQPERFLAALSAQFPNEVHDAPVVVKQDHDSLIDAGLWSQFPKELPIVVTAKDWVKLRERPDVDSREVLIALQEVRLEPHEEFEACIVNTFDE